MITKVATDLFLYCCIHLSEWIIEKEKKSRVGLGSIYWLVDDWKEADLNANLQSTARKGRCLSGELIGKFSMHHQGQTKNGFNILINYEPIFHNKINLKKCPMLSDS